MIRTKPTYIFTNFVSDSIQEKIHALRNKLGIIPYEGGKKPDDIITLNHGHITMKRAFYLQDTFTEQTLLAALSSLSFKPIQINITKLEIFESPELGKVLVGLVEENKELLQLHMDIYSYLEGKIDEKYTKYQREHFSPHVSFIYELSDSQKDRAISEINTILPITYMLDSLQLLKSNLQFERTRNLVKEFHAKK